ncbi:centrosomal protein of 68 kDa [Synchiropus picturatus]
MELRHRNEAGASTSSFLSNRKYLVRQPLFPEQAHSSILQKDKHLTVCTTSGTREAQREEAVSISGAGLRSEAEALTLSGLDKEESLTPRSPRWSSSPCSTLEVQRLNLPLRPQLSSTVLHPTYTSKHRRVLTHPRIGVRGHRLSSSAVQLEGQTESCHQRSYWACAIPKASAPSADRQSADWDPDTEYQALLDYSYPLRADYCEGVSSHVWSTEANLQDSGIELDRLCSRIRSLDDLTDGSVSSAEPLTGFRDSWFSPETNRFRSTSLLPKSWTTEDLSEEFLLLPDHLEELQSLAQQVNEVSSVLERVTPGSSSLLAKKDDEPPAVQTSPVLEKLREEQKGSLMEHIQTFSSHLQQLIQWLHTISEKKAVLTPPTLDRDCARQSLAEYQSFQREVGLHQPLTSSILKSGHLLLSCVGSVCPDIRDTLLLIEQQSTFVEKQAQQLLASILSAMDSLTQPSGLDQQVRVGQDLGSVRR